MEGEGQGRGGGKRGYGKEGGLRGEGVWGLGKRKRGEEGDEKGVQGSEQAQRTNLKTNSD